jgi:HEPN domain-containing protein
MKKLTKPWVRKAEDDFLAAEELGQANILLLDQICFHCQQSAEKYLKALLQEHGASVPRTHVLQELLARLLPQVPSLRGLKRGAEFLTRYAVETRLPWRQCNQTPGDSGAAVDAALSRGRSAAAWPLTDATDHLTGADRAAIVPARSISL